MKQIRIQGGNILSGTIRISGAKNSAVALIPASILADDIVRIDNIPNISDIEALNENAAYNPMVSVMVKADTNGNYVGKSDSVKAKGTTDDIEKGDTVYTSGYSSIFPADIPLGIAGDSKVINGATNEIKISLFQDFTALRFVTVVYNTEMEELEALEQ